MGSWDQRNPLAQAIPGFKLLLLVTSLRSLMPVKQGLPCSIYPEASAVEVVSPRLPARHRNLNRFPFHSLVISCELRIGLLLADKRCQETRVLSASGILIRIQLLLTPGYAFLQGPCDLSAELQPLHDALLPDCRRSRHSGVSATGLAPIIFGIRILGRSAITRCLKDGCF